MFLLGNHTDITEVIRQVVALPGDVDHAGSGHHQQRPVTAHPLRAVRGPAAHDGYEEREVRERRIQRGNLDAIGGQRRGLVYRTRRAGVAGQPARAAHACSYSRMSPV
jgi:hypothetical protein